MRYRYPSLRLLNRYPSLRLLTGSLRMHAPGRARRPHAPGQRDDGLSRSLLVRISIHTVHRHSSIEQQPDPTMSSFELMLELLQRRMDEASESLSQLEVRHGVSRDYR